MAEFISLLGSRRSRQNRFVIRVRGLPWSSCGANVVEILQCPSNIKILNGEAGVHFTLTREGRSSGEAYIELESQIDMDRILEMEKKELWIDKRYVEVFKSTAEEMEYVLEKAERQANQPWDNVIKVKGLPYKCSPETLRKFFKGMETTPDGILMLVDTSGKNTGEGYLQFTSQGHAEQALLKHKESIDRRYIEVYKSSRNEMCEEERKMNITLNKRPRLPQFTNGSLAGVGPDGVYCHLVQMRGLPFKASEFDIKNFFGKLKVSAVQFEYGIDSRPTGRATVAFASHKDAQDAMQFDKSTIGNRYIELFLKSTDSKPPHGIGPAGQYLFMVQMRGLPFKVTAKEIAMFFSPVKILDLILEMGANGPSGTAKVAFYSQEDLKFAFSLDKKNIGDRYIELFPYKPFKNQKRRRL